MSRESLREGCEGFLEQLADGLPFGVESIACAFRGGLFVAHRDERSGDHSKWAGRCFCGGLAGGTCGTTADDELIFEVEEDALDGLLAHAADAFESRAVFTLNRSRQRIGVEGAENRERELGPNAGDAQEGAEGVLVFGGLKPIEHEGVFTRVRVNVERELSVSQAPKATQWNEDLVADAVHVEEDGTIELSFDDPALKTTNHGAGVARRARKWAMLA
ncbi:MAG: hypothetical protein ACI9KE_001203 [Polyangiales bacterium]|jgi:hypothetical protein